MNPLFDYFEKSMHMKASVVVAWIVLGVVTSLLTSFLMAHYFTKL